MSQISQYIVSLWKNKKWQQGGKMPYFTGTITAPRDLKAGEQIRIALWNNDTPKSENSPQLSGKEDTYQAGAGNAPRQQQPAAVAAPFEDAPW